MEDVIARIFDGDDYLEFQPDHAPEMLCAEARLSRPAGRADCEPPRISEDSESGPRIGGIVYTESARKVAYFVENAERNERAADLFAGRLGIHGGRGGGERGHHPRGRRDGGDHGLRHRAENYPDAESRLGAGYYAMAGQGFDPNFTFGWPTARIGVMEGDAAVQAVHGPELES